MGAVRLERARDRTDRGAAACSLSDISGWRDGVLYPLAGGGRGIRRGAFWLRRRDAARPARAGAAAADRRRRGWAARCCSTMLLDLARALDRGAARFGFLPRTRRISFRFCAVHPKDARDSQLRQLFEVPLVIFRFGATMELGRSERTTMRPLLQPLLSYGVDGANTPDRKPR